MVRAGVVCHPSEWSFGRYNEIQETRRKCLLINYQKIAQLTGYVHFKKLLSDALANDSNAR